MFHYLPLISRRSLGGRVMSILGIALLSSLILFALSVFYFVNRTEGDAWRGRQSEAARNASGTVSNFIHRVQDALVVLSTVEPDHHVADDDELESLIDQNPALLEVVRIDSAGEVIASAHSDNSVLANLITIPQSQWYLQAHSGQTYIGNVQLSARNEPYIIMAVPSLENGVVAARVQMNVLWDVVQTIHFGQTGQAYLITRSGQIIAHTDLDVVISQTTIKDRPEFIAMMGAPDNKWFGTFTNFEGKRVVGSTSSIEDTDWLVVTELPVTEAFASTRRAIYVLGSIAFLLLILTNLIVARHVQRQIVKPMDQLQFGAEAIGQGNLEHRIGLNRGDEIGQVANAFDVMASQLQQRETQLAEQTRETFASEARYRAIVEDQTEFICRFLPDGTLTFVNETYCRYFNKQREELIGRSFMPLIPDEDRTLVEAQFSSLGPANPVISYEHRVIQPDGSLRWHHWTDRAIFDSENRVVEYASVGSDITDRKIAQIALQASEKSLRRLTDNMYDVIMQINPEGSILYASPSHEWVLGTDPETVIGRSIFDNLHEDDLDQTFALFSRAVAKGVNPEPFTLRYKHKDGHYLWMESAASILTNGNGEFEGAVLSSRDITQRLEVEAALRRSEQRYRLLAENASDVIWIRDMDLNTTYISPAVEKLRGYTVQEALSQLSAEIFTPESLERSLRYFTELRNEAETALPEQLKNEYRTLELEMYRKDGSTIWAETQISFLLDERGKPTGILSVSRDITERRRAADELRMLDPELEQRVAGRTADLLAEIGERQRMEAALRESEERYVLAVRGANDGLWDWNFKTNEIYYSPRWKSMLGYQEEEISNAPKEWLDRIHPEDRAQFQADLQAHLSKETSHFETEFRIMDQQGREHWVLCRGLAVRDTDGTVYRMAGSQTDITDRKLAEERLSHDALHDALTGLPNRILFADRLEQRLERSKRHKDDLFAVLFIDLDRFKVINDSLGHTVGDRFLITTAYRLQACLRPDDTISRFGGDEFAVLLNQITDISDAIRVAERIEATMKGTTLLGPISRSSTASIGITVFNGNYNDPQEMLRDANSAMYRAKGQGGGRYQLFDVDMYKNAVALLQLETDLKRAVEKQEWQLYYQPIISLPGGNIAGVEALIRWNHPQRGIVSPAEFIGTAEESGLILQIGEYVLRKSCMQIKTWREAGFHDLWVSVNISGRQFQDKNLLTLIEHALMETGIPGDALRLEVTETVAMKDIEYSTRILKELDALGIYLSLDDFGNGYSSLGYLKRFPLKVLKIDRSFIQDIEINKNSEAITSAIISMGHTLNLGSGCRRGRNHRTTGLLEGTLLQ